MTLVPQRRLLWLALAWTAAAIVLIVVPAGLAAWQGAGLLWIGIAAGDAWAGRRVTAGVTVRRAIATTLPVGGWQHVELGITSADRPASGRLRERVPAGFDAEHDEQAFRVAPGEVARLAVRVRPLERGTHTFGPADLRLDSPLGLWHVQRSVGEVSTVRVYPDFARIVQYTLLATDHRLSKIGVLQQRRRGEGSEFHQLRDYRQDDSPRQIDWNATSRVARLISREYQDERDQQLMLVIDAGSRMRAKDDDLSHFDHALNASLLLAYVALRQGDAAGLCTFGQLTPRYVSPRPSQATMSRLLNAVFDVQPSVLTPDYVGVAQQLRRSLSRRTLVVVVTTLRDEDREAILEAAQLLRRHHVLVVADLRETALLTARQKPIASLDDALTYAAAVDYLERRRHTALALRRHGVSVIDTPAGELAKRLVNLYWEKKRTGAA